MCSYKSSSSTRTRPGCSGVTPGTRTLGRCPLSIRFNTPLRDIRRIEAVSLTVSNLTTLISRLSWDGESPSLAILLAGTLTLCSPPPRCEEQQRQKDRAAILALVEKINRAWTSEANAALVREILSDKAFVLAIPRPNDRSKAAILDKASYCQWSKRMIGERRPREHKHTLNDLAFVGPLAFEVGTSIHVAPEGEARRDDILNVFAEDETGWKLIFSTVVNDLGKSLFSSPVDEEILRDLAQEFAGAFRTERPTPIERIEEMLSEDFVQIRSIGEREEGKEANLTLYREGIQEIRNLFRVMTVRFDISRATCFRDGGVVSGKLVLEGRVKDTDEPFRREIWETLVFRKDGDAWRLIQEHSTRVSSANLTRR